MIAALAVLLVAALLVSPLALNLYRARRCRHTRQRCIHGDEINAAGGRRARCLDCWALLGDLPADCCAATARALAAGR